MSFAVNYECKKNTEEFRTVVKSPLKSHTLWVALYLLTNIHHLLPYSLGGAPPPVDGEG